ncbi:hypothetical protein OIE13_06105 [Streptosporangium sp. NBC_01810]|uniref:hypothetical protein n=1 Tax=Streptosporangium sp. NBC_01810 TaxID=2975951 RepID=UPI002DD8E84A|nr:hypothetical protein [Streptosporangium sp. NBC_01810]WSA27447.1 hypothetical protein OIE13_06105 [Streptosporangium sp. NBC_01810]
MTAGSHERGTVRGCLACADPGQLLAWLASERAKADEHAARATTLRAAGEETGQRHLAAVIAGEGWKTLVALQQEHLRLCGESNAYAQRALIIRGHADLVEAAHPQAVGPQQSALFGAAS